MTNEVKSVGLLLSNDLIFATKIKGTAEALGYQIVTAGSIASATKMIDEMHPKVVFLDLAAGEVVSTSAILSYRPLAPATPFVAFGSHVDVRELEAAKNAGCDPVLPRSRFSAELPDLIRRYLED